MQVYLLSRVLEAEIVGGSISSPELSTGEPGLDTDPAEDSPVGLVSKTGHYWSTAFDSTATSSSTTVTQQSDCNPHQDCHQ